MWALALTVAVPVDAAAPVIKEVAVIKGSAASGRVGTLICLLGSLRPFSCAAGGVEGAGVWPEGQAGARVGAGLVAGAG